MKRRGLFLHAAYIVALLASAAAQAGDKIRVAGNFAVEHSSSIAIEQVFKPELAKLTGGRLQVDIFPAMQLGGAKENVDAVRSGTLFMTWVGVAFLARIVPELEAVSLPFEFPSRRIAFEVMDGKVGRMLDQKLNDKGFVSLGWMELGARQVTNNKRPIRTLADFKGLKIRVQPDQTYIATFRALGANPVPMDVKELYSALQQGVVDAQENPYSIIAANRYDEVQKYLSNTAHFFDFIAIVANRREFEALSPEHQKAIRRAMADAVKRQRTLATELDAKALEQLKKKMQFDAISPQTREEMRKATAGVVDIARQHAGAAFVDQVLAAVAEAR